MAPERDVVAVKIIFPVPALVLTPDPVVSEVEVEKREATKIVSKI